METYVIIWVASLIIYTFTFYIMNALTIFNHLICTGYIKIQYKRCAITSGIMVLFLLHFRVLLIEV